MKRDKFGAEISSLSLRFLVSKKHFIHGLMKLKCTAKVARLFVMSNNVEETNQEEEEEGNAISVINHEMNTKEARNYGSNLTGLRILFVFIGVVLIFVY